MHARRIGPPLLIMHRLRYRDRAPPYRGAAAGERGVRLRAEKLARPPAEGLFPAAQELPYIRGGDRSEAPGHADGAARGQRGCLDAKALLVEVAIVEQGTGSPGGDEGAGRVEEGRGARLAVDLVVRGAVRESELVCAVAPVQVGGDPV